MDTEKNAYEELLKGIAKLLKETNGLPYDITKTAVVSAVNTDGYDIKLNGIDYYNVPTLSGTCNINETVRVTIPENNLKNMFILK